MNEIGETSLKKSLTYFSQFFCPIKKNNYHFDRKKQKLQVQHHKFPYRIPSIKRFLKLKS